MLFYMPEINIVGKMAEGRNALVVGAYNDGSQIYDLFEGGWRGWTACVKDLIDWAERNKAKIEMIEAV